MSHIQTLPQNPFAGRDAITIILFFGIFGIIGGGFELLVNLYTCKIIEASAETIDATGRPLAKMKRIGIDEETKSETAPFVSISASQAAGAVSVAEYEAEAKERLPVILNTVSASAWHFHQRQFGICTIFTFVVSVIVIVAIFACSNNNPVLSGLCLMTFVVGSACAGCAAIICRQVAMYFMLGSVNAAKKRGIMPSFRAMFRVGSAASLLIVGYTVTLLYVLMEIFKAVYYSRHKDAFQPPISPTPNPPEINRSMLLFPFADDLSTYIATFAVGASMVSLFSRYGGSMYNTGAYTAAAIGGNILRDLRKYDCRNPACKSYTCNM